MSSVPWYLPHLESISSRVERDRDHFFPENVRRFDYLEGYVTGFLRARESTDLPAEARRKRESVTRENISIFIGRHYNGLRGARRWSAGHGMWRIIRAETTDDDAAVTTFVDMVKLFRAHQNA